MYKNHEIGKIGEKIAQEYLKGIGYKIIQTNFECKQGEIDIIAKDKNEIVFIEVKTRCNIRYGEPKDAVNKNKEKHIYKSAEYYVFLNNLENIPIRIDVIEIKKINEKFFINHIKQAMTEKPR